MYAGARGYGSEQKFFASQSFFANGEKECSWAKKKKKKTTVSQIYIMSGRETCWAKEWHRTGSWGLVATGRVGREHLTEKLASERRPETV